MVRAWHALVVSIPVLAIVLLVALTLFGVMAAAVGRLPGLVPAESDNEGTALPDGPLAAEDLPRVRFSLALRGYRMSEVDAFVERVRAQLGPEPHDEAWPAEPVPASEEAHPQI
jgi:DivIVA domain-containing protein